MPKGSNKVGTTEGKSFTMKRNNVTFILPLIDGTMKPVKASEIEGLFLSKGGNDSLVSNCCDGGYEVLTMPAGTIDKYFDKSWEDIIE